MSARGALLLNRAAQVGDKRQWLNALHYMQMLGTNTAQGLQAMNLVRTLNHQDKLSKSGVDQHPDGAVGKDYRIGADNYLC